MQREAGSALGEPLALPQIAAVAALARKLRTAVARPTLSGSTDHDIELWVQATPQGDEIALSLEGWTVRAPAGPRLAAILGGGSEAETGGASNEWAADEELRIISLSQDLADLLGVDPDAVAAQPLTRVVRLDEDENGEMPLISALAARRSFSGQRARSRMNEDQSVVLSGEVVTGADGAFAGFRGSVQAIGKTPAASSPATPATADLALDQVLRSPLDRIIESAERIVERADGPLRSDYASYGSDIATAARHLLSVLQSMSEQPTEVHHSIDLAVLAGEAAVMLDSSAGERDVVIELNRSDALPAKGDQRAVIQILVNLIGNAIRHSPDQGRIRVEFTRGGGNACVSVQDQGPGVAAGDRARIFERFERDPKEGGTGLGLAISRRLARSMGGDVTLDSAPGEGARFTLTLPVA